MTAAFQAKLLEIHCSETGRYRGMPLHEAIVERCKAMGIAGATVLGGIEGYGETGEIHRPQLAIAIADTPENIERLAAELEPMLETGLMTISAARAIRVEKSRLSAPPSSGL